MKIVDRCSDSPATPQPKMVAEVINEMALGTVFRTFVPCSIGGSYIKTFMKVGCCSGYYNQGRKPLTEDSCVLNLETGYVVFPDFLNLSKIIVLPNAVVVTNSNN